MLLGFDIGGTKCAVAVGNHENGALTVVEKRILPTREPAAEMISALFDTAAGILEANGISADRLEGIGISCGGPLNSSKGVIMSPPNLPGWDNIPIVEMVEGRFGKKALLQNDANACAVAEWRYGAGRGYNNVVFLTFGTGMGAGLILNGNLYTGNEDCAGEVGHIRLAGSGPVGFGKAGSFEGFCSGGGIAQLGQAKARELINSGSACSFCKTGDDLLQISARSIAEAALAGDDAAIGIYTTCAHYLGRGLSVIIDILNPELIILGGIYLRAQALIEPEMRAVLEKEALPAAYSACRIVPAGLGESIGDIAALSLAGMCSD